MVTITCKSFKSVCIASFLASCLLLNGCTTNPATGRSEFTPFLSPDKENQVGAESHRDVLNEYGGEYQNPQVQAYVQKVANRITPVTERSSSQYRVSLLDSPVVNAFALPGGYLYVTRGLVALANSESELAGVLGHEAGHVTARHAAGQSNVQAVSNLGAMAIGLLTGSQQLGQLAQVGAKGIEASYSRSDEHEADELGIRYLAKAGYNPMAQSRFLNNLRLETQYQKSIRNQEDEGTSMFASHPDTAMRVSKTAEIARTKGVTNGFDGFDTHRAATEGMLWGDNPQEGVVIGDDFIHPQLNFAFTVPRDFVIDNQPNMIVAVNNAGGAMQFTLDPQATNRPMSEYITYEMARGLAIQNLQPIDMPNMQDAATVQAVVNTNRGQALVRMYAVRDRMGKVYQFMFSSQDGRLEAWEQTFLGIVRSLRSVNDAERQKARPARLHYHRINAGDSIGSLAQQMQGFKNAEHLLRVMNGMDVGDPLAQTGYVKMLVR